MLNTDQMSDLKHNLSKAIKVSWFKDQVSDLKHNLFKAIRYLEDLIMPYLP